MDRTIPTSGNEEIQLYMRTYYSLLRSTRAVPIKTVEEAHKGMHSALHVGADDPEPDMAAFIYCHSAPAPVFLSGAVGGDGAIGQVFATHGYDELDSWQEVSAPGRRRRSFFDGDKTLAVFIASRSDIDDLIPILTAYQIERRKLHRILNRPAIIALLDQMDCDESGVCPQIWCEKLADETDVPADDWERLHNIWRETHADPAARHRPEPGQEIAVRSLSGLIGRLQTGHPPLVDERRNRRSQTSTSRPDRSILSPATPTAWPTCLAAIRCNGRRTSTHSSMPVVPRRLQQEYHDILEQNVPSSRENFLYYAWKKFESATSGSKGRTHRSRAEHRYLPCAQRAQRLRYRSAGGGSAKTPVLTQMDGRLRLPGIEKLAGSEALIVNIDYPLGMAAYQVLTEIARNIAEIRGVFIMGKAATLNGHIGDVMIPNVVHDEQSLNTYLFNNCFSADDIAPYLVYGTVLDNQKAISVPGTFLQNEGHMSVFHTEGYTDMEMEAGPYLSSIYEMVRPKRYPQNELVDLHSAPFPVGILHYASDTPFSKGKNLGSRNLSYYGMDPTYATMIAILRELLGEEIRRSGS